MMASQFHPTLGKATSCSACTGHRPRPARFIWHHVLPLVAGGRSRPDNMVPLCDNCHFCVHALMFRLRVLDTTGKPPTIGRRGTYGQRKLAREGYAKAVAAGTVSKLPDEGGELE